LRKANIHKRSLDKRKANFSVFDAGVALGGLDAEMLVTDPGAGQHRANHHRTPTRRGYDFKNSDDYQVGG